MKNRLRKMIMAVLACVCFFAMPVYAAEDINTVFEQGRTYSENEQYEEAIACYEKVIELAQEQGMAVGDYIGCYRNIAISYGNLELDYKAIETLHEQERLLSEIGSTTLLPEVYLLLSEHYYNIGIYQHAADYGKKAIEMAPHQWLDGAYRITGLALMECGRYEEAIMYLQTYLDNSDNRLHGLDLMAQCYEAMGENRTASELYMEIASSEEKYLTTYTENAAKALLKDPSIMDEEKEFIVQEYLVDILGYGDAELQSFYFNNSDYDKAFEYMEKVLAQNPDDINTLYNYGGAKCNNGEYAEAEEAFRKVYEMSPEAGYIALYLGYALEGQGKYEEALPFYQESLERHPEYTSAVLEMKDCYLALGRREEALAAINDVIESSGNADISLITQYVNLNSGFSNTDFGEELAYYSKAKGWPEDTKQQAYFVINNISISYLSMERLDAYINFLESQDTSDYLIACELAYCYRNKGEYAKAIEYLEAAKAAAPYCADAILQDEIAILHTAGDIGKAISVGNEAADKFWDNEYLRYYATFLDMIYNENYEIATTTAMDLLATNPDSTYALELLYMGYMGMEDYESALEYVNQYLEVSPTSKYAKAYMAKILRELGQQDTNLENELLGTPMSAAYSDSVYVPAILGDVEKVRENLPKYLEIYPSEYTKAAVAKNTAMAEVITDPEIAALLGIAVEEVMEETVEETETEEAVTEDVSAEEAVAESANEVNTGAIAKTAVSAFIMLLGVGIVVINLRKSKKK